MGKNFRYIQNKRKDKRRKPKDKAKDLRRLKRRSSIVKGREKTKGNQKAKVKEEKSLSNCITEILLKSRLIIVL